MSKIKGKRIGQLVISADVVTTAAEVEQYVSNVSADLQKAIDEIGEIAVSGYVPLSALSSEVLKIISANYLTVSDILADGLQDNQAVINSGNSQF